MVGGEYPVAPVLMKRIRQMNLFSGRATIAMTTILLGSSGALAAGDPSAGKSLFASHCAVCHSPNPGDNKTGPSLAGIVGSNSGAVPGFRFSTAMNNAGVTWDDATLDKFLANPTGFIHGTMMFVGLPNASDRADVIAYLHTLKK
ncbi:MAG: c-type cytochrome [Stellaceae bacterium]